MRFESFFDRAQYGTGLRGPHILYHYTSWDAAEKIIRSQRFRATAHDCTNDKEELTYADTTILDAARALEQTSSGIARRVLRLFLKTYEYTRIGATKRTYLVCFSEERDDPHQWCEYGANGTGVCLGLRLFGIPHPAIPNLATGFLPIQYGDRQLRDKLDAWYAEFVEMLKRVEDIEHNWRLSLDSLNATATAWALSTKGLRWKDEHEVRMIFLVREGKLVTSVSHERADGSVKRYIEVPLTRLRRMPIEEFIVGPNQDFAAAANRAVRLLAEAKYRNPEARVVPSIASMQNVA